MILGAQIMIVAFIEEIIFRGLMLNILLPKGIRAAVLTSSLLFAITHSLQLLGGQSLETTILQISYAFFIGMVLSLLIVNQQSIIIAILFHGLNNSLIMMGKDNDSSIYTYIIILLMIIYTVFLWIRALKTGGVIAMKNREIAI